jgi:hypothetical protein
MKKFIFAAALMAAMPAFATGVGVSLRVGQPGFYGAIDIGNFPQPQVVNVEPVVVRPVVGVVQPLYLHVPPGQMRKWSKYCGSYRACGRPVYFVQHDWYENTYAPHYRGKHGFKEGKGHGKGNSKGHGGGHGHGKGRD